MHASTESPVLLHTPDEAAELLRCSRRTVYGLMTSGALKSVKLGHLRRIPDDALRAFVDGLRNQGAAS